MKTNSIILISSSALLLLISTLLFIKSRKNTKKIKSLEQKQSVIIEHLEKNDVGKYLEDILNKIETKKDEKKKSEKNEQKKS